MFKVPHYRFKISNGTFQDETFSALCIEIANFLQDYRDASRPNIQPHDLI
jgi:hypothetical protein